ncbi:MTOR-associated protein MEAK7 isoform X4 [Ursus arctos]|uniref:MTOR-associated protein MEAK7 isoform X4 n=1 Tax=Ursus arctos TaxID=9644 RepID=UPI002546B1B3|nr:MTOR-associated protein MEAK7 isoform X4 [Ursus arctos]
MLLSEGAEGKSRRGASHVGEALPLAMVTRLYDGMRGVDLTGKAKGPSDSVSQEQFTVSMSHLLKGNSEEKSLVILKMISPTEGPVKAREVQKFTEDLVGSVVHVLNYRQELRGWTQKRGSGPPARVQVLAAQLFSEMDLQGGEKLPGPQQLDCECDRATIEAWVFRAPHVATFLSVVIHRGFLLLRFSLDLATLVPERHVEQEREFESILDVLSVIFVNSHLRQEQRGRWRLLFSSELHGHSFAQLCGRITHRGPCVLLLEDHDGQVFGGFASCSWEVKPQFQGDDTCFLFSISPRMAVYTSTGYNDHYMYLNHGQQTIPNGLGMGGQHNYFGLWVDVDFGKGHSKAKPKCTTYNSPQLSAQEDFGFEKMEVWAVGDASGSQQVSWGRCPFSCSVWRSFILNLVPELLPDRDAGGCTAGLGVLLGSVAFCEVNLPGNRACLGWEAWPTYDEEGRLPSRPLVLQ